MRNFSHFDMISLVDHKLRFMCIEKVFGDLFGSVKYDPTMTDKECISVILTRF